MGDNTANPAIAHHATVWQVHAIALGQSTFSLPANAAWVWNWSLIIHDQTIVCN